jgi:hypothetical protein
MMVIMNAGMAIEREISPSGICMFSIHQQ